MVLSRQVVTPLLFLLVSCLLVSTYAGRTLEQSMSLVEGSAGVQDIENGHMAERTGAKVSDLTDAAADNPPELVGPPGLIAAQQQDMPPADFLR
jgi:hypothetical protein